MGAAWAEDTAPVANHTDAEAAPIDTSIATQRPSHFRREPKWRDAKKYTIAHPSGNSGDHRTSIRGTNVGVVRNAIGQPVHRRAPISREPSVKASERTAVDGALKNGSSAGNVGTEAGGIDSHRQGFVPLRADTAVPRDPRTQYGDEPFDHRRSRYDPSGVGRRRDWWSGEERRGCYQRHQLPAQASVINHLELSRHGLIRPLATALIAASVRVAARSLIRALSDVEINRAFG